MSTEEQKPLSVEEAKQIIAEENQAESERKAIPPPAKRAGMVSSGSSYYTHPRLFEAKLIDQGQDPKDALAYCNDLKEMMKLSIKR